MQRQQYTVLQPTVHCTPTGVHHDPCTATNVHNNPGLTGGQSETSCCQPVGHLSQPESCLCPPEPRLCPQEPRLCPAEPRLCPAEPRLCPQETRLCPSALLCTVFGEPGIHSKTTTNSPSHSAKENGYTYLCKWHRRARLGLTLIKDFILCDNLKIPRLLIFEVQKEKVSKFYFF